MRYKKYNDIAEISVQNPFTGAYYNHRLNFAVDHCYVSQMCLLEATENSETLLLRNIFI